MHLFPAVPFVLEELLDASCRLRAFALQNSLPDGLFGRRVWALAELIEHDTAELLREWVESVHPCDSCGEWCVTRTVIVEGVGLARSTLCSACAGGTSAP